MNHVEDYMVGYRMCQRHLILDILERDDVLGFIGYIRESRLLDVYVAAIPYYQAWSCFDIVREYGGYNMAANSMLTLYVAKNMRLTERDVCWTYRKILQAGGRWSPRTIHLVKKYRSDDLIDWMLRHGYRQ